MSKGSIKVPVWFTIAGLLPMVPKDNLHLAHSQESQESDHMIPI